MADPLAADRRRALLPSAQRRSKSEADKAHEQHRPGGRLRNRPGGGGEHAARMRVVELFRVVDSDTVVKQQIKAIGLPCSQNSLPSAGRALRHRP